MAGIDRRTVLRGTCALAATFAATACNIRQPPAVTLSAGEAGGFFWEFSGLLAGAADRAGTVSIARLPSGGSAENLDALRTGRAELALSLSDTVFDAADSDHMTAVGRVYENYFQVAVRDDSPIRTTDDLRGATVSIGALGSGAASISTRVLEAAGLAAPGAVQQVSHGMREAASALNTGTVDAVMWAGGLPTPTFADNRLSPIRLLDLTSVVAGLERTYGTVYEAVSIPADVYGRHPAVTTVGVANLLLARSDLASSTVAKIVDLLLDDASSLIPTQAIGSQFLDEQSLILTGEVALHPGAAQEYRRRHG